MITFFVIGAFILILTKFSTYVGKPKQGLFISFILIFLFLALRFEYGNDYIGYYDRFNQVNIKSFFRWFPYMELGWLSLIILFKPFGFFSMVFFLAIINCVIYYWLIVKYVDKTYYWFALFIYYLDSNFFLIHLSAMRQSIGIAIFLFSLKYILQKKYLKSIALLFLAVSFHASALFLLPILFLSVLVYQKRINSIRIAVILLIFISLFLCGEILKPTLLTLVKSLFGHKYLIYLKLSDSKPEIINIVTYTGLLFVILFYYNKLNDEFKLFANLLIVGFFIIPISFIIPLSIRLAYYFLPLSIVLYPYLTNLIKPILTKQIFVVVVVTVIFVRLFTFLNSSTYGPHYERYNTIFTAIGK